MPCNVALSDSFRVHAQMKRSHVARLGLFCLFLCASANDWRFLLSPVASGPCLTCQDGPTAAKSPDCNRDWRLPPASSCSDIRGTLLYENKPFVFQSVNSDDRGKGIGAARFYSSPGCAPDDDRRSVSLSDNSDGPVNVQIGDQMFNHACYCEVSNILPSTPCRDPFGALSMQIDHPFSWWAVLALGAGCASVVAVVVFATYLKCAKRPLLPGDENEQRPLLAPPPQSEVRIMLD